MKLHMAVYEASYCRFIWQYEANARASTLEGPRLSLVLARTLLDFNEQVFQSLSLALSSGKAVSARAEGDYRRGPGQGETCFFCLVGPRHWRLSRVGLKQDSRQRALIYEHGRERREKYVPLPESSETRLTQSPRTCWGGALRMTFTGVMVSGSSPGGKRRIKSFV